jgi:hypothetical protein
MYEIISEKFIKFEEVEETNLSLVRAEIVCDSSSDLPEVNAVPGRLLAIGSIAWCVDTGAFYGLSSEGTWYNQDGSGTAGAENSLQSNTAASPDRLIKQSVDLGTIEDDIIPNDIAESEDEPILSEEEQKDEVIEEPIVEKAEKKGKIVEAKGDEDAVRNTENI